MAIADRSARATTALLSVKSLVRIGPILTFAATAGISAIDTDLTKGPLGVVEGVRVVERYAREIVVDGVAVAAREIVEENEALRAVAVDVAVSVATEVAIASLVTTPVIDPIELGNSTRVFSEVFDELELNDLVFVAEALLVTDCVGIDGVADEEEEEEGVYLPELERLAECDDDDEDVIVLLESALRVEEPLAVTVITALCVAVWHSETRSDAATNDEGDGELVS